MVRDTDTSGEIAREWGSFLCGVYRFSRCDPGDLRPTTHRNGIYELRLSAEDTSGHSAEVFGCLLVDGRFKVGQSSIGGIDFNIPQLGYPLLAGRVYDSRNLDGGSFGPGWGLPHEGSNVQAEFTYEPSEGWGEDVQGGLFSTYILVPRSRKVLALRLGEGVFKFRMEVTPKTSFMRPIMDNATPLTVSYVPVDDTKGTLETPGAGSQVFLFSDNDGTLAYADEDNFGEPYNPTLFKLTLDDGSVYLFDKEQGAAQHERSLRPRHRLQRRRHQPFLRREPEFRARHRKSHRTHRGRAGAHD